MCGARPGLLLMALAVSARAGPFAPNGPPKAGSQSIEIELGTSGAAAAYSRGLSGWFELGARGDWQGWSYQETVSLVALGARALLRAWATSSNSALGVTIEVSPGARRLTSRVREVRCQCTVDLLCLSKSRSSHAE